MKENKMLQTLSAPPPPLWAIKENEFHYTIIAGDALQLGSLSMKYLGRGKKKKKEGKTNKQTLGKWHLNDTESFPGNIKSSLKFTYSML